MLISGSLAISNADATHSVPEDFSYSSLPSQRSGDARHNPEPVKSEKSAPGPLKWAVLVAFAMIIFYLIRKFGGKGKPPPGNGPERPTPPPPPARQSVPPQGSGLFAPRASGTPSGEIRLDPDVGMPNLYTVRDQIDDLATHGALALDFERRANSDSYDLLILFAAQKAIEKWHKVVAQNGTVVDSYKSRDSLFSHGRPYNGRLPISFLEEHIKEEYSDRKTILNLRPAVFDWIREASKKLAEEITAAASFEKVRAQLLGFDLPTNNPRHINFLAMEAIKSWNKTDQKTMFVDVTQETPLGELFGPFIRNFVGRIAPVKLEELRLSWRRVPEPVRPIFGQAAREDNEPDFFVDLVMTLEEGEDIAEIFTRQDAAWQTPTYYKKFYKGRDLHLLMNSLVNENAELAHYPKLLEKLAKLRIDASINPAGRFGAPQAPVSSSEVEITSANETPIASAEEADNEAWVNEVDPGAEFEMLDDGIFEFWGVAYEPFMDPVLAL